MASIRKGLFVPESDSCGGDSVGATLGLTLEAWAHLHLANKTLTKCTQTSEAANAAPRSICPLTWGGILSPLAAARNRGSRSTKRNAAYKIFLQNVIVSGSNV